MLPDLGKFRIPFLRKSLKNLGLDPHVIETGHYSQSLTLLYLIAIMAGNRSVQRELECEATVGRRAILDKRAYIPRQ
jgi:hypothetical protein